LPIYTRAQLKSDINSKIKGKLGMLVDQNSTINQGVREVVSKVDLITTRRRSILTPNLFKGVFEYASPTDLKGYGIITVQNQKWDKTPFWTLVPYEQFMRRQDHSTIAISDYDFIRKVFIDSELNDDKTVISNLDALTSGGGLWGAFGDAENVRGSSANFVEGQASIMFDIDASGGTTAGIDNSTLDSVDLTAYFNGDSNGVLWAYLPNAEGITNIIIRNGSDASNYYSKTVTAQSDGTAFAIGWNLLNFNLSTFDTVGTPVVTAMNYSAIYMTKVTEKISQVGFRFDAFSLRRGEINNIYYYSSFGWQTEAGVYIQNSTEDTDVLNAHDEEYALILSKCSEIAADDVDEEKVSKKQDVKYKSLEKEYKMSHPSESLIMIGTVATFVKV